MKIIIPLSQFEQLIINKLYIYTFKGESLTPITEKELRNKMKRKSSLHTSLKRLVEKGYAMSLFKENKYYFAMSPEGKKIYDLLGLIADLDLDMTDSEREAMFWKLGYNGKYQMKEWWSEKMYAVMCNKCFSIRYVEANERFDKNILCIRCEIEQSKNIS